MQQIYGIINLIHYLVNTYYAHLTSVLIIYESGEMFSNSLQHEYLGNVQQAFENQSRHGSIVGLQWLDIRCLTDEEFSKQILNAVDREPIEGFITILGNTTRFLHARYYSTRYTTLRLKDKIYLFFCDSVESPKVFLTAELLQFYPHHLMVIPETIYSESNNAYKKKLQHNVITTNKQKMQNKNIKETSRTGKELNNKLEVTNATTTTNTTMKVLADVTTSTISRTTFFSSFFYSNADDMKVYKYRDINFELWTQQYVGAEGNLNAVHLDTYISGNGGTFAKNIQLYPNKLLNLQQRTIRVGTLTYVPYVKTDYVPPGQGDVDSINTRGPSKTVQFTGTEGEIIKTFCEIHNCHLRVKPYAADNWGSIYENGTVEGMLGDLYKQHTEIAIGCIYNWYNDLTETSQFIARSAVTFLGPGPAYFPRWRTVAMPFSNNLWLFLAFTILICSIVFHFIKYSAYRLKHTHSFRLNKYGSARKYEKTLLDIFAVFIQQPSADTILHRIASRVFLAFLLCATITLENTYSGQLKSILTMPLFNKPVDTMQKWSLTDWKWAAPSIIWVHTVENSDLEIEQRLAKLFEVRDHDFLYNATYWNNYGIGIERVYSGSFTFGDYITGPVLENKIVIKDDLYFDWTRAIAIRGWPLMPLLDRHILYCLETGIYMHWEKQFSYKLLNNQIQDILQKLASGYKPKSPPQMLSIEHISGPLLILLFGYFLAFLVLIIELFGHRIKMALWKCFMDFTKKN